MDSRLRGNDGLECAATDKPSCVYILASFTKQYAIKTLVWYETHTDIREAITREKQRKKWNRDWKINLIQSANPTWHDLYPALC